MEEPDLGVPSPADLAAIEAELPEWDRLRVRDHWDAVVAEELGAPEPPDAHADWSDLDTSDRVRLRRHQRRADNRTLRLITTAVESPVLHSEEAA